MLSYIFVVLYTYLGGGLPPKRMFNLELILLDLV